MSLLWRFFPLPLVRGIVIFQRVNGCVALSTLLQLICEDGGVMFGYVQFQGCRASFSLAFVVFQFCDLFRPTELYSSKIGTVRALKTHAGPRNFLRSAWCQLRAAKSWDRRSNWLECFFFTKRYLLLGSEIENPNGVLQGQRIHPYSPKNQEW